MERHAEALALQQHAGRAGAVELREDSAALGAAAYAAGATLPLPKVTAVVINYNYGRYLRRCVGSLLDQDYPNLEIVVVDNASTDESHSVISALKDEYSALTIVWMERNEGPMGGGLHGMEAGTGEFICFIDADDFYLPGFVSAHVQAHLAARTPIGVTTSRVLTVDENEAVVAGGLFRSEETVDFVWPALRGGHETVRLPTIDEAEYETLRNACAVFPDDLPGWLWTTGAGSANMFRRQIVELARPDRVRPDLGGIAADGYYMSIDSYYLYLGYWLAGCAAIGLPLVAYRIHGSNMKNRMLSMRHFNGSIGRADAWSRRRRLDRADVLLSLAPNLADHIAPKRLFQILQMALPPSFNLDDPEVLALFERHSSNLVNHFGVKHVGRQTPSEFLHAQRQQPIREGAIRL